MWDFLYLLFFEIQPFPSWVTQGRKPTHHGSLIYNKGWHALNPPELLSFLTILLLTLPICGGRNMYHHTTLLDEILSASVVSMALERVNH